MSKPDDAGISPNPRDDEIAAGRELFRTSSHDGIVAVGGGSGMDGGKAIATVATNDIDLWAFEFEQTPPDMSNEALFPPLICIPTTAGTGAETEGTAMISETARMMEFCTWHPKLKPSLALLDPEITIGLPTNLTAWTGCDAMAHGIEAHHGLTNAVVLPAVLRFNAEKIADKVPQMAAAMDLADKSFDSFYRAVCEMLDVLDIPKTLADIGVPVDCAATIAEKALQDSAATTNPRQATVAEIQGIIETALTEGR
jgi:alcohol dehydrogenase class IV